jgi:hypothetical protein
VFLFRFGFPTNATLAGGVIHRWSGTTTHGVKPAQSPTTICNAPDTTLSCGLRYVPDGGDTTTSGSRL